MGSRKNDKHQLFTRTYTNQTTSWLVRNLNTFGARTSHGQTRIHNTPTARTWGNTNTHYAKSFLPTPLLINVYTSL